MSKSYTDIHTVPYQRLPALQHLRSHVTNLFTAVNTTQVHVEISQDAAVSGHLAHQLLYAEMADMADVLRPAPVAPYGFIKIRNMVLFWRVWYFTEGTWQPLTFEHAVTQAHTCYVRISTLTEWMEQM